MRNKGVIIILIVILSILVIGLTVFLYMYLTGRMGNSFFTGGFSKSENIIFDQIYVENIKDLEIKSAAGDITFEKSTDENIRVVVYGKDKNNLEVTLKDDNLEVDYSVHHTVFNFGVVLNDIIIYIPENYSNYINIKANYGDIKIIDLENTTINIEEDCGDVELGKIRNAEIDNSYGDIKIDTVLNKCKIKNDCGNIKINNLQIQEESSIESSLGDVKIGNTNDIYVDAKTDLGDLKINTNNRYSETILRIKNSCGDIKIEN